MIRAAAKDAWQTAKNGFLLIAAVFVTLAAGPHAELALAPPVTLFEVHNPRIADGRLHWSVVVAQKRRCIPAVQWSTGGKLLAASGPPLDLRPGEAFEVGPFSAPLEQGRAGQTLDVTVIYNCGLPWGLAPIRKSVLIL